MTENPCLYQCPLCQQPLSHEHRSYVCPSNHRFDQARQGYVNLLPVQHKKSKLPGDPPDSIDARRAWLTSGGYDPLVNQLAQIVGDLSPENLLDAGCAEGYYTRKVGAECARYGVDIAKHAVKMSAQSDPAGSYAVASVSNLPIQTGAVGAVMSVFSPIFAQEFARVLVGGGSLIAVVPAPNHLLEFRQSLFDQLNEHSSDKHLEVLLGHFDLVKEERLSFELQLDQNQINALLSMTPFAWRASRDKINLLTSLEHLSVQADFNLLRLTKR